MKKIRIFKKTFNPNLIRIDLSYSANDIVGLLGVHKRTVLAWHEEGLHTIDDSKPYLFHGKELRRFIKVRQHKRKHKCADNEFYCFKCRQVRTSKDNLVWIRIKNEKYLHISGVCAICGHRLNRAGVVKDIEKIKAVYMVKEIQEEALLGTDTTSPITHLKGSEEMPTKVDKIK